MGWKSSSTNPWQSGSLNYVPEAGEFTIDSAPAIIQLGVPFLVECSNLYEPSAASLNGLAIDVYSYNLGTDELFLVVPEDFAGKHGSAQEVSVTAGGYTRTFTVTYNPPDGWSYVVFEDPTNDPENAAFYNLRANGDPTTVATGEQGVYENEMPNGWAVVIDPDNTIAVDSNGESLVGTSVLAYVITDDGRGTTGNLVLDPLSAGNNAPPVWGTISNVNAIAGAAITVDLSEYITDPDDDSLGYAIVSGGTGLSVNTGTGALTGSKTGAASTYAVTVSATDGYSDPVQTSFNIVTTLALPTFGFSDLPNQELGSSVDATTEISGVPDGSRLEFSGGSISVNNGLNYTTSSPQYLVAGQTKARITITTSGSYATPITQAMTINGVSRSFTATTIAAPSLSLSAVRNSQAVTLTASASNFSPSSVVFQVDSGSGFSTINTDSSPPFTYSYDISGFENGDVLQFRAVNNSVTSNAVTIRVGNSSERSVVSNSHTNAVRGAIFSSIN